MISSLWVLILWSFCGVDFLGECYLSTPKFDYDFLSHKNDKFESCYSDFSPPPDGHPAGRAYFQFSSNYSSIFIYGGWFRQYIVDDNQLTHDEEGVLSDFWVYSIDGSSWAFLESNTSQRSLNAPRMDGEDISFPGAQYRGLGVYYDGFFTMFGNRYGLDKKLAYRNDIYYNDGSDPNWLRVGTTAESDENDSEGIFVGSKQTPGARNLPCGVLKSNGEYVVFGGYGYITQKYRCDLNDMWKLDLSLYNSSSLNIPLLSWERLHPSGTPICDDLGDFEGFTRPSARLLPQCWLSVDETNFYVFGGEFLGDVWKFDLIGKSWTYIEYRSPSDIGDPIYRTDMRIEYPNPHPSDGYWAINSFSYGGNLYLQDFSYSTDAEVYGAAGFHYIFKFDTSVNVFSLIELRPFFSEIPYGYPHDASFYQNTDLLPEKEEQSFVYVKGRDHLYELGGVVWTWGWVEEDGSTDYDYARYTTVLDLYNLTENFGDIVDGPICYGHAQNEDFCGGSSSGYCGGYDSCDCGNLHDDYFDPRGCEKYISCFGIEGNDSSVCGGSSSTGDESQGDCVGNDTCRCFLPYFGKRCELIYCPDVFVNDSKVTCNGNGNCDFSYGNCSCLGFHFGDSCNITMCNGYWNNDTTHKNSRFCSGKGKCTSFEKCTCSEGYFGGNCSFTSCNGYFTNETYSSEKKNICNGRGKCISYDLCNCTVDYYIGNDCENWYCYGIPNTNVDDVCTGRGLCSSPNNCTCYEGFFKRRCDNSFCFNISEGSSEYVCNGHGDCVEDDVCQCLSGYSYSNTSSPCDYYFCWDYSNFDHPSKVCSGRGKCVQMNLCECLDDYEGDSCNTFSCGFDKDHPQTCSGKGVCTAPLTCKCNLGRAGDLCQENLLLSTVMAPILSVSGIAFILIVLCCGLCIFCVCATCCVCFAAILVVLFFSFVVQNLKLKKFFQLNDLDLILQEQLIERDDSVAHIKINKELFVIDYDEIKVEKLIGSGGSSSNVYLANWSGKKVAFKCFKTRSICSSQNSFHEFEQEVEVLSGVKHPNIIQFFGATLKPPRVGILMEYCSNGDLEQFCQKYREKNSNQKYPVSEKWRILQEVSSSFEYLHERNIIHRDLKLANVLLNDDEVSKLMDFGLSKRYEDMGYSNKTQRIGTDVYMPPELILSKSYNEKCDAFSFGIFVWILITENYFPYGGNVMNVELRVANDQNYRPNLLELRSCVASTEYSEVLCDICEVCWKQDPELRYSFVEVSQKFQEHRTCVEEGDNKYEVVKGNLDGRKEKEEGRGFQFVKKTDLTEEERRKEYGRLLNLVGRLESEINSIKMNESNELDEWRKLLENEVEEKKRRREEWEEKVNFEERELNELRQKYV